jgi:hypothetical protein
VDVARLRHANPKHRLLGEMVAVDDRDPIEVIGEHTPGQQASEASADDNSVAVLGRPKARVDL